MVSFLQHLAAYKGYTAVASVLLRHKGHHRVNMEAVDETGAVMGYFCMGSSNEG